MLTYYLDINIFYLVASPAVILAVIFIIFMFFALIRLKTVMSAHQANTISKLFYLFIALETITRIGLYIYIIVEAYIFTNETNLTKNPMVDPTFLTFLYLPDLFFWLLFTLLLWQLLVMFYGTHMINSSGSMFVARFNPISKRKFGEFFVFVWIAYIAIELVFIALFQSEKVSLNIFAEQNSMFNFLLPFILFVIEVILHITFSGTPYISLLASHKKGIINKVLIAWAIGRILHAIWSVYLAFYAPSLFFDIMTNGDMDSGNFTELILIISFEVADKIVNEALPLLFVFDLEFVNLFYRVEDVKANSFESRNALTICETRETGNSLIAGQNQSSLRPPLDFTSLQIVESEEEEGKALNRKNGFGKLEICFLKPDTSKKVLVRKIKIQGFSNYLAEEFLEELAKYFELQVDQGLRLNRILDYSIEEAENERNLCLISNYCGNGSLSNLLKTQKNLNFKIKSRTALETSAIMMAFHSMEPALIHGHLTSYNIVFDEEFRPIICDYGFFSLRKYYIIRHGYSQKSIYMAPELLRSSLFKRERSCDVYSFGMILYELFVGKVINENLSNKRLIQLVCEEKSRPKIPEGFDKRLANLIRCCWQEEADKRPTFNQINDNLQKILGDDGWMSNQASD